MKARPRAGVDLDGVLHQWCPTVIESLSVWPEDGGPLEATGYTEV